MIEPIPNSLDPAGCSATMGFSVIVPTDGRVALVERLLTSLDVARTRCSVPSEVIIIDSSPEMERDRILSLCHAHAACYLRGSENVRKKRNLGIRQARYPFIVFTDSDCRADPDLLMQYLNTYRAEPQAPGVLGRVIFEGSNHWLWEIVRFTPFLDSFSFATQWPYAPWGPTANISYKQQILSDLGMFDETFPFKLGGDDLELGLRASRSGHMLRCNPDAIVYHAKDTWVHSRGIIGRAFRWGRMEFHILKKHPELKLIDHPKLTVCLVVLMALSASLSIAGRYWLWLAVPGFWTLGVWVLEFILTAHRVAKDKWHIARFLALILAWLYELGYCYECVYQGQIRWLAFRSLFHVRQLEGEWPGRVYRLWSILISTALVTVLMTWLD